ncbi:unnamed protein product, partial [Rotaria magnacalcarata]
VELSGNVAPPGLFDGEPTPIVYDPNRHISNHERALKPFESITTIENTLDDYLATLQQQNRVFITSVIQTEPLTGPLETFVQRHLQATPAVMQYYLIFSNGANFHNAWTTRYGSKLVWCRSFTERLVWDLREVCATANHLNIDFCQQRAQQSETQGDISIANMYAQQHFTRINFQIVYLNDLQQAILQAN